MKKFENKKTELKDGENEMGFADLAIICLNTLPQGGLSPQEMAKRIKLINPLEDLEIGKELKIEDADFEVLKTCSDETKWRMIHKDIVAFHEYIDKLSKT